MQTNTNSFAMTYDPFNNIIWRFSSKNRFECWNNSGLSPCHEVWAPNEVDRWLCSFSMQHYAVNFFREGWYCLDKLKELDLGVLEEIGVLEEHACIIMEHASALHTRTSDVLHETKSAITATVRMNDCIDNSDNPFAGGSSDVSDSVGDDYRFLSRAHLNFLNRSSPRTSASAMLYDIEAAVGQVRFNAITMNCTVFCF